MKILSRNITSNGYVDDQNVMVISENKSFNGESFENVVTHEAVHLMQLNSAENVEDGNKRIGVCICWDDEKINTLDWSWFYEASAALCMENTLNTVSGSYRKDIEYVNTLKTATFLNSPTATTLEELCNNKEIENFFEYFGCQDDEDKSEIVAMMYSIEIISNKPDGFMEAILNDTSSFEKMKRDIYLTMTKYFYENIYENIEDMSIGEVFSLISLFEMNLNNTLVTNYYKKFDANREFMKAYSEIQQQFFTELAENLDVEYDTVYHAFLNYSVNKSQNEEINIAFVSAEKNSWLNKQKDACLSNAGYCIQEDYRIFQNDNTN